MSSLTSSPTCAHTELIQHHLWNHMAEQRKWKILVLHGFSQSAAHIRARTAPLRRALKHVAEFDYMDAPHRVALNSGPGAMKPVETTATKQIDAFGWWHWDPENPTRHQGWQTSIEAIRHQWMTQGPYDAIFGFSQGAGLGVLLCAMQQNALQSHPWLSSLRFAILVSGFKPGDEEMQRYFHGKIALPTLHVAGHNDMIVTPQLHQSLARRFVQPDVMYHDGGHTIPAQPHHCHHYLTFVQKISHLYDPTYERLDQHMHRNDARVEHVMTQTLQGKPAMISPRGKAPHRISAL